MAATSFKQSLITTPSPKYADFLVGNNPYLPPAFESIATATGTGSSNTITFSSIPSGYKALQIRYIGKSTQTGTSAAYTYDVRLNGDTGTNYARHQLTADGTTVSATGLATQTSTGPSQITIPNSGTSLANMFATGIIDLIDYTSTTKAKTIRGFIGSNTNGTITTGLALWSGLWFATPAAVTSISLIVRTGSWTTTSSFALYGVK